MSNHYIERFQDAYVECALWSSCDDDGNPLDDNYSDADIAPETLAAMRADCVDFLESNSGLIESCDSFATYSYEQAGYDFWLTRNRHGAGFWDRGFGLVGQQLTDAAHVYGSVDLYVGDDGKVQS